MSPDFLSYINVEFRCRKKSEKGESEQAKILYIYLIQIKNKPKQK